VGVSAPTKPTCRCIWTKDCYSASRIVLCLQSKVDPKPTVSPAHHEAPGWVLSGTQTATPTQTTLSRRGASKKVLHTHSSQHSWPEAMPACLFTTKPANTHTPHVETHCQVEQELTLDKQSVADFAHVTVHSRQHNRRASGNNTQHSSAGMCASKLNSHTHA
jgi:hypothetical protein